jgi:hypothetical protein
MPLISMVALFYGNRSQLLCRAATLPVGLEPGHDYAVIGR